MIKLYHLLNLVLLFLLLSTGVSVAQAQVDDEDRQELEGIYQQMKEALKNKDVDKLTAFYAKDFQIKLKDGRVISLQQQVDNLKQLVANAKEFSELSTKIEKMSPGKTEDEVIIEINQTVKMVVNGPDNQPHQLNSTVKRADSWEFVEDDGWKLKLTTVIENSTFVDGQKVQ